MLKNCLPSLFVFLIPLLSFAQSAPLTYEDFVHLPEKEKDRFVIKTMQLMVNLENYYRNDPRALNISQDEEDKKFTLFINQLKKQFFIPEAYAYPANPQADAEWKKSANEFKDLITKPSNEKKCVFAGWISKAIGSGKNTICAHPGFILGDKSKKNQTPEGRAYIAPSSGSSCDQAGQKMIQCNPVIFGYKSIKDKTPFCVSAENMARNSSLDCMQAARDLDANNKGDSKADRLNYLKDMLTQNKSVFKDVHEFNYKMCVCETKPIPDNFSKDYLNLIQLHQTCYGIMKMIGEVVNSCSVTPGILPEGMNPSIFENLKNHISGISQDEKDPIKNRYGFWYSDYIKKLRQAPTQEYARLCGGPVAPPKTEPKPWTCSGKCKIEGDKLNCDLSVKKPDGKSIPSKSYPFNKSDFIGADNKLLKDKNIEIAIDENGSKKLICSVDIEAPIPPKTDDEWPKYTCESKCTDHIPPQSAGKTCEVRILKSSGTPQAQPTVDKTQTIQLGLNQELDIKDPKGNKLNCPITTTPPQPQPKPKDPAKCMAKNCVELKAPQEGSRKCDLVITSKVDGQDKTIEVKDAILKQDLKYKHENNDLTCTVEKQEPKDDTKPTLEVTATEKDERSYNVKAVKTNDEGWSFSWVVKASSGSETPDVSKDWEDKTDTPPAGTQDDGTTTSTPSAKTDFVQKRAKVDFNICGQLKKGEETIEKCAPIKKYVEEKKPDTKPVSPFGQGNIPAAPQPMIRNSSDTGAVGVR